ncbi:hypothetical protein ACP6PL_13750 [Dapis sp. BLCC M126]|uniref:hypothetical protein n=1 Tax=Dapis sp. BLCC M126 TaxID=3400189 RepID=UPI003CF62509
MNDLAQIANNHWMGRYLKILAFVFIYSGLIHIANIVSLGEKTWLETPQTWQIGDIVYGILDLAAVIGLWQGKAWVIICFLVGIISRFVIYTVFIDYFPFTQQQRETIYGLLGTEVILLSVFVVLLLWKK